jgi:predicted small secreted protein
MDKRKFLILVMVLLFVLQLTGCTWTTQGPNRDYTGYDYGYGQFGRDDFGFPGGHEHN